MAGVERDKIRQIVGMMQRGKGAPEIAETMGIGESTVYRLVSARNLDIVDSMLRMADAGMSLQKIGEAHGVTKQRVSQLIGVEANRGTRGKSVWIDAAPETWTGVLEKADELDIPVKGGDRVDARAVVVMLDGIADGSIAVRKLKKARKS